MTTTAPDLDALLPLAPDREADAGPEGKAPVFSKGWTEERRQAQRDRLARSRAEGKMRGGRRPKTAPSGAEGPRPKAPDRAPTKPRQAALKPRLEAAYVTAGTLVCFVNAGDGQAIIASAGACAEALDELAKQDPRVRAALDKMLTGGAWSKVLAAHLPIALALVTNHGLLPAFLTAPGGLFGGSAGPVGGMGFPPGFMGAEAA